MPLEGNRSLKHAWPLAAGVLIALGALAYGVREHSEANELAARHQTVTGSLCQLPKQVQAAVALPSHGKPVARPVAARPVPEDTRWKQMDSRLSEHNEKLASTQEQMAETREELQGRLSSTKDELVTSIARTHEEVVALQKRGERDYHEFNLATSKEFRRIGPLSLSLRKADTKHKRFDIELIVDDVKLQKKNVNLYEPVYLTFPDRPQPVELVANQVSRNQIQGYISVPKYKMTELTADAGSRGKLTP